MSTTNEMILSAAEVEIEAAGKDARPKISVVAYTGRIMRVPGWGDIAIDLAGLEAGGQVPLLADHNATVGSVVGHGEPAVVNGRLRVAGVVSGAGEPARHVVEMARGGFQFQASVGVAPTEHERVKPNQSVEINGRSLSSPSGFTLVRKGRLREVSITPLGADAETSVAIAASRQGRTNMADIAHEDQIRADERDRLKEIELTCRPIFAGGGERDWGPQQKRVDEMKAKAVAGDMTVSELRAGVLEVLRASRPVFSGVITGGGSGHIPRTRIIEAAILKRAGFAALAEKALGPACMEAADDLRVAHTLDLCRAALQHEGIDTPADREGMVRASLTTHTLTEALGAAVNKVLLDGYQESPATWRSFAGVRSVPDFKTATAIRPSFTGSLQQIPPGGEFKHGGADEATTQYKVDTYGKMFSIDRRDLINDDLSLFDSVARAMGQAAMRKLSDLVYDTLLSNAGAFFSAGNGNYITGADTNLSTDGLTKAITAMLTQRDAEGNDLDLRPTRLVVPPELQTVARAVLESEYIAAQTNLPTGNSLRNAVGLEVEPRLSNTKKYGTKASTKHWYLFAAPAASPIIVGFLNGQQTPPPHTVEFFGLDQTVNKLAQRGYAPVQLARPIVQPARPTVRADCPIGHSDCPPARLKWPSGRVDGEVVRVMCAVGHSVWPFARLARTLGHFGWPLPEYTLMAERRFPRPDGDFSAYMNHYYEAVEKFYNVQGLDPSDLIDLKKALDLWNANYPAHVRAQAAAEAARQNKDAARRDLEAQARPITSFVQGFPKTTDADRATIGITVRDSGGTPTPTPTTRPQALVQSGQRLTHTLRLTDESTPTRRARPKGVLGAEVWLTLIDAGQPAPTDPNALAFLTMAIKPTIRADFRAGDGGKTAVYMLRWVNTQGEKGPWSEVTTATVAA